MNSNSAFADALIAWHAAHGRHDLPWQQNRTPYRVWVSEIMLQQTQVTTVIGYFERFMARFPDPPTLAAASVDEVLHLWTGLGYYARGRNLHRAALRIRDEFGGEFPTRFEDVESLPGIGRSTAGAILALSQDRRFPILDGNVRRVLSRWFGIDGDPTDRTTTELLWNRAEECTPQRACGDLHPGHHGPGGDAVHPKKPSVPALSGRARAAWHARAVGSTSCPIPKSNAAPDAARQTHMVVALRPDGSVFLRQRPPAGIWGGLWAAPAFDSAHEARGFAHQNLGGEPVELPAIEHAFTHFDLTITPWLVRCQGASACHGCTAASGITHAGPPASACRPR